MSCPVLLPSLPENCRDGRSIAASSTKRLFAPMGRARLPRNGRIAGPALRRRLERLCVARTAHRPHPGKQLSGRAAEREQDGIRLSGSAGGSVRQGYLSTKRYAALLVSAPSHDPVDQSVGLPIVRLGRGSGSLGVVGLGRRFRFWIWPRVGFGDALVESLVGLLVQRAGLGELHFGLVALAHRLI